MALLNAIGAQPVHHRFEEHSVVRLRQAVPSAEGILPPGARGTIVHRYESGLAYEVEFVFPFHTVATVEEEKLVQ